ncbi:MAG: hypothetical protein ACOY30_01745 [Bacillota bacterium]
MTENLESKILAVLLEEAAQVLEKAGNNFEVEYTTPAGPVPCEGRERVVRFRFRGDTAVVTVAREQVPGSQRVEYK